MNERFRKIAGMKFFLALLALAVIAAVLLSAPQTTKEAVKALLLPERPAQLLFVGDLMLDRAVRLDIEAHGPGYPFEKIAPLLAGYDLVVANAEGPFTDRASVSVTSTSTLIFTFPTSTLPVMRSLGFTDLSQANNHALNFGWAGLAESKQWIAQSGMHSFGDPDNNDPGPQYETVRGQLVALVGYDEFSSSHSDVRVLSAIAAAHAQGAFTVVFAHWGVEYDEDTTTLEQTEAHKFIDAGADAIMGAHPHVVEPYAFYRGKPIFYSLGNFVFDQSWEAAVSHGLAVEISLTKRDATYTLIPISISHAQPQALASTTMFSVPR